MRSWTLTSVLVVVAFLTATSDASAVGSAPAAAASSQPPASGAVGLRLVDVPTAARDDPRARQYIVDHLQPGAVIRRRIEVANTTGSSLSVMVYPAAASITGGSFAGAEGRTANELSSWTTLSQGAVELAPGAKTMTTVTVTVPTDAAPGEQYAAVWAEITTPGASGVLLVNRVGIRMYLSVGGGNPPPSGFTVDSLTAQRAPDGRPLVTAQVQNTGGRALDMSGTLSLTDGPGSLTAGPFAAQLGSTVAPGQSAAVTIPLDQQLPNGPWSANLKLKSGLLEQSATARITFPDAGAADPVAPASGLGAYLWLLIGALVLLAALLLAALWWFLRRRRRIRDQVVQHVT